MGKNSARRWNSGSGLKPRRARMACHLWKGCACWLAQGVTSPAPIRHWMKPVGPLSRRATACGSCWPGCGNRPGWPPSSRVTSCGERCVLISRPVSTGSGCCRSWVSAPAWPMTWDWAKPFRLFPYSWRKRGGPLPACSSCRPRSWPTGRASWRTLRRHSPLSACIRRSWNAQSGNALLPIPQELWLPSMSC